MHTWLYMASHFIQDYYFWSDFAWELSSIARSILLLLFSHSVMSNSLHGTSLQHSCLENPMDGGAWGAAVHGVTGSRTWLRDFTFTFHFHALENEMATHSSVLAWRIPGTGEPGGLPSMGSHRVGHDWSDLAAAAAAAARQTSLSITISWSLLKIMPTESVMWPNHHSHSVGLGIYLSCICERRLAFISLGDYKYKNIQITEIWIKTAVSKMEIGLFT